MADMSERISSLSPRQLEVLRLVAERLSSKEIGRHLGLSPATVDSHIATAIQRLDLGSRREAAILMLRYDAEMSAAPGVDEAEVEQTGLSDRHHGEEPPPHSTMMAVPPGRAHKGPTTSKSPGDSQGDGGRRGARFDGWLRKRADPPRRRGMGHVLFRCLLDAIYIICFFITFPAPHSGRTGSFTNARPSRWILWS